MSAGRTHTLALVNGFAWGWGSCWMGQLGNTWAMRKGMEVGAMNTEGQAWTGRVGGWRGAKGL